MLLATIRQPWVCGMAASGVATFCLLNARRWTDVDGWRSLRWVIVPTLGIFTWCYSAYDFNFFLNQPHLWDRGLLFATGLASIWRPSFLGLFLLQLGVILAHLGYPLAFSWTDKSPLIDVLVFTNVFLLGWRYKVVSVEHFLAAVVYIVAIHYFRPGIGKLLMGWLSHNNLSNLFLSAVHQNGWLAWSGAERVSQIASITVTAGMILMIATMLVELVPIFYLSHRGLLFVGLLSAIGMHIAVFLSSGILFWKWIILDFGILIAIASLPNEALRVIFNRTSAICLVLLLVGGYFLYVPAPVLAWYDAPLSVRYHVQVTGVAGRVYQIPPSALAPFDLQFAQGRLHFLDDEPMLVDCLGSCSDAQTLEACKHIGDGDQLAEVRRTLGKNKCNLRQAASLQQLLRCYVSRNKTESQKYVFDCLPDPPQHIWTYPSPRMSQTVWDWQEEPVQISVRRITAVHRNFRSIVIEDRIVQTIDVSPTSNQRHIRNGAGPSSGH